MSESAAGAAGSIVGSSVSGPATVRVYVTNYNCRAPVELCIRSIRRHAGYPFALTVGDSGSTDRSPDLLRKLARRGWITLEEDPTRTLNDWMDHFLATCRERFAVFVHADVEFRESGWLLELVTTALRDSSVMVYSEMVPEVPSYVEPHIRTPQLDPVTGPWGGSVVRLGERPGCWVVLADVPRARKVPANFQDLRIETNEVPEGRLTYNTGGAFFRELRAQGIPWTLMSPRFQASYHHYGSMGWVPYVDKSLMPTRFRLRKQLDTVTIRGRLWCARIRDCTVGQLTRLRSDRRLQR